MAQGPRLSLTLYRALLRVLPRGFRRRFGDDMAGLFADHLRDARRRGTRAVVALWARAISGLVRQAIAERRENPADIYDPPHRQGARMRAFVNDFRAASRSLWRRPGVTLAAMGMLAVGLGFNTALFAVVNAVVLKPLPYSEPDRVVMLWTGRNPDGTGGVSSYADYATWKARSKSFRSLAAYNIAFGTVVEDGEPEEIGGAVVDPDFFAVLGARMALGRPLQPGDEKVAIDAGRPVVISHGLWMRRFHGDPQIVGRGIVINERRRRIVGVLGQEYQQPEPFWGTPAEFWVPMASSPEMLAQRGARYLRVIGRLGAGVTTRQAAAEMDAIGRALMDEYPLTNKSSVVVAPIHDELMGDSRPLLGMFIGAVGLVLLLAVANIINLLLANVSARRIEMAVRSALGASRARLMSQLVLESTLMGLAGGAAGLVLASASLELFIRYGTVSAPGIQEASIDGAALVFATLLSGVTGAVAGLLPAARAARTRAAGSTESDARGTTAHSAAPRRWLVAAEMALAVPLLVGAALLAQTLVNMQRVDPGFDADRLLQFRVTLSGGRYKEPPQLVDYFDRLRGELRRLPGVGAVGMVSSLPLGGLNNTGGALVYRAPDGAASTAFVGRRTIAGDYFQALGISLVAGRAFDDATDQDAVIVNDVAARQLFGERNAIGERVRFGNAGDTSREDWKTIVGVVTSVRHEHLTRPASAEAFVPYRTDPWSTMTVAMHTPGDPSALVPAVRGVVTGLDPRIPVVGLGSARVFIEGQLAQPRFGMMCAVLFGVIGLALAAFGTFAVLSLLVAQRTREIGIRMALGATRARVATLVFGQSIAPALAGCVAGALAALWLTRLLGDQLFGVTAHNPVAFTAALACLTAAAAAASWWPTRRATRIDPATTLRS